MLMDRENLKSLLKVDKVGRSHSHSFHACEAVLCAKILAFLHIHSCFDMKARRFVIQIVTVAQR